MGRPRKIVETQVVEQEQGIDIVAFVLADVKTLKGKALRKSVLRAQTAKAQALSKAAAQAIFDGTPFDVAGAQREVGILRALQAIDSAVA